LPLFGIGKERTSQFWRGVLRQLVARGALRVKSGEYASLELVSDEARPILRGETRVMLADEPPAQGSLPVARTRSVASAVSSGAAPAANTLFEALRTWRMEIAKAQAVPPYVIFHDTVLRDIAAVRPANLAELAEIKGVGASKLDRYGVAVLALVQRHGDG
jgi:ATP-dependent DNA helicase RecQ